MKISLISFAKADIRTSWSALEAVRNKEGNEKATKGIAAYHAQQAIEKIIKAEIYRKSVTSGRRMVKGNRATSLHPTIRKTQV